MDTPLTTIRREAKATLFDIQRELYLDPLTTLELITASKSTNEFETFFQISGKWRFKYDEFRKSLRVEIADSSNDLTETMVNATHLRIGDDVYVIRQADTLPPQGQSYTWKIFADRKPGRNNFVEMY